MPKPTWAPWRQALFTLLNTVGAVDALENDEDLRTDNHVLVRGGWRGGKLDASDALSPCGEWMLAGIALPNAALRGKRHRAVRGMVKKNAAVRDMLASGILVDLIASFNLDAGETAASAGVPLDRADHEVLTEMFAGYPGGAKAFLTLRYCSSPAVICNQIDGDGEDALRVTGLRLVNVLPVSMQEHCPNEEADPWSASVLTDERLLAKALRYNIDRLPPAAARLPYLRVVDLGLLGAVTGVITGEDTCRWLESLPALEVLHLRDVNLPAGCTLRGLRSFETATRLRDHDTVPGPAHRLVAAGRNVGWTVDPLPAAAYTFLCNSPLLTMLSTGVAAGLPACLGQNVELRRLDLRGSRLQGPLPGELRGLTKLVDFIAFEQAARYRPSTIPGDYCKLAWLAKSEPDPGDDEATLLEDAETQVDSHSYNKAWHCASDGWSPRFDDPDAAWWGWRNLERFWVDVNFFHGSIPPWLPTRWPRLRSLDLYSNELTGDVPASLLSLTQLDTLQLHDNRLSGPFPFEALARVGEDGVLSPARVNTLTLAMNEELEGCLTRDIRDNSRLSVLWVNYTQIRVADAGGGVDGGCNARGRDEL